MCGVLSAEEEVKMKFLFFAITAFSVELAITTTAFAGCFAPDMNTTYAREWPQLRAFEADGTIAAAKVRIVVESVGGGQIAGQLFAYVPEVANAAERQDRWINGRHFQGTVDARNSADFWIVDRGAHFRSVHVEQDGIVTWLCGEYVRGSFYAPVELRVK